MQGLGVLKAYLNPMRLPTNSAYQPYRLSNLTFVWCSTIAELDTWVLWGVGPLLSKVEQVQYAVYSLRYIPHLTTGVHHLAGLAN